MALILVTLDVRDVGAEQLLMRSIVVSVSSTTSCNRLAEAATTSSFNSTRNWRPPGVDGRFA
jgi:hypothetical protein